MTDDVGLPTWGLAPPPPPVVAVVPPPVVVAVVPLPAVVPLLAVVLDEDEELPHAPTATAAAMANGIIFFKASLHGALILGRSALGGFAASIRRTPVAR